MLTAEELDRLHVVLIRPRNPLNIGAAARAMSNFGFLRLGVVNPYDLAFREARSAVDAAPVLAAAEAFEDLAPAIADCSLIIGTTTGASRQLPLLHSLEDGAAIIRDHLAAKGKVALLFGSEKVGLSNHDLNHCHLLIKIPTRDAHLSMNLGQAVAVCLYELIRQSPPAVPEVERPRDALASADEVERLISVLLAALDRSGHVNPTSSTEERLRRLLLRLHLTSRDTREWLGLFRQILWKLQEESSK